MNKALCALIAMSSVCFCGFAHANGEKYDEQGELFQFGTSARVCASVGGWHYYKGKCYNPDYFKRLKTHWDHDCPAGWHFNHGTKLGKVCYKYSAYRRVPSYFEEWCRSDWYYFHKKCYDPSQYLELPATTASDCLAGWTYTHKKCIRTTAR